MISPTRIVQLHIRYMMLMAWIAKMNMRAMMVIVIGSIIMMNKGKRRSARRRDKRFHRGANFMILIMIILIGSHEATWRHSTHAHGCIHPRVQAWYSEAQEESAVAILAQGSSSSS